MGAIKIGGIVSGMDTNAIVEQLVAQSRIPITNLENKYSLKQLEKDIYQNVSDRLGTINSNMLTLRLESTFKTKFAETSNSSSLGAVASTSAANGSYSVNVKQIAKSATWSSSYTRQSITLKGAGITGTEGLPTNYFEGRHTVTVSGSGSGYKAVNSFKPNEWGTMNKYNGAVLDDPSVVSSDGTLNIDINAGNNNDTLTFNYSDGTINQSISITISANAGDDINKVTNQIQSKLNDEINAVNNTQGVQYLAFNADYDETTSSWSTAFYKPAVFDYSLTPDGGTAQLDLGLSSLNYTKSVSTVEQYFYASDLDELGKKLNNIDDKSGGVLNGVKLVGTGLTEGTFSIIQDSSLLVAGESYSTVKGGGAFSANPSTALETNISAMGASASTNGYFTINDTRIYVDDFSNLTVNDLLAKINSSGAGVTASYNQSDNNIVLTSNNAGSMPITIGNMSDTSNALSILKLTSNAGAVKISGSTSGSIQSTVPLNNAGFSAPPTSGTFSINGVAIYVDATKDSLKDVIAKVNQSGAGVTMVYDAVRDKVSVVSDKIDKISFGSPNDTSSFLDSVNMKRNIHTTESLGTSGQNAIVDVNGITYVREKNSIDDIIAGVTLDVRSVNSVPTTLTISSDTTKATEALASFIKNYNELMTMLDSPTLTNKQKEYLQPLSDEDKQSMSDDDLKNYQALSKEYSTYNIINKSSELRSLRQNLRSSLFIEIKGASSITNLLQMGIDIAGKGDLDVQKKGLLVEDTTDYDEILSALESNEKLQKILSTQPDAVYNFFSANIIVGNDDSKDVDEDGNPIRENDDIKGWTRLYGSLLNRYTGFDGMIHKKIVAQGTLDNEMLRLALQLENQESRVEKQLERYWAQFTAMEKAMAEAQELGNSLGAMTGGSSG